MRSSRATASRRSPARRRIRRAGFIALAALAGYALLGLPFFVFPHIDDPPPRADVVLVLGPISEQRIAVAKKLVSEGKATAMLWSIPIAARYPDRPEHALIADCGRLTDLTCFYPEPTTTEGEGLMLARYARQHGSKSVIVVTQTAHISRARTIVQRCFAGRVSMVSSGEPPEGGWLYQYAYQTAATVKLWLNPPC